MINDTAPLLAARNISKRYPGVQALDGAQITVHAGRLTALLGENGAGKSTLMGILTGCVAPDAGEVLLHGRPVAFAKPRAAQAAGIAIIHQELNLAPNLTVAENIFLGREPLTRWGLVDRPRMEREARDSLAPLGPTINPATLTERLSIAEQQTVEIAKALSLKARVLILDEPTSALTHQETAALFELLRQLKSQGVGMIYITHRLDELAGLADDITVLRDGKFIAERPFAGATREELVRLMVGRELAPAAAARSSGPLRPLLEVRELSLAAAERDQPPVLQEISLAVGAGEIVGLFGLLGAGRTELMETLFGVHPHRMRGEVLIGGEVQHFRSPAEAIRAGLALAPEDRKRVGLHLNASVSRNISLPSLRRVQRGGLVSPARETAVAQQYVGELAIKTPSTTTTARNLSGGNQQKVVLAKWLATNPRVLLVDEPTRGVDVGAKAEIYALLRKLALQGLAVLMASSELPEVLALSDRILVLREGRLAGEFSRTEATEETLLAAALPSSPN